MAPTDDDEDRIVGRGPREVLAAVGGGIALVLCCAVPVLLAAGLLGVVGAFLREHWLLVLAAVLLVLVVTRTTWTAWRRHTR